MNTPYTDIQIRALMDAVRQHGYIKTNAEILAMQYHSSVNFDLAHEAYRNWYIEETETRLHVYSRDAVYGLNKGFMEGFMQARKIQSDRAISFLTRIAKWERDGAKSAMIEYANLIQEIREFINHC